MGLLLVRPKFVIFLYCYAQKDKKIMSTLLLEVNTEQEEVLKTLLRYMKINFQKVESTDVDFWESLSPAVQNRIERGLADAESGRYVPAQSIIDQLMGKFTTMKIVVMSLLSTEALRNDLVLWA